MCGDGCDGADAPVEPLAEVGGQAESWRLRLAEVLFIVVLIVALPVLPRAWMYEWFNVSSERGASLVYTAGNLVLAVGAAVVLLGPRRERWAAAGLSAKRMGQQLGEAVWVALCAHAVTLCTLLLLGVWSMGGRAAGDGTWGGEGLRRAERLADGSELGGVLVMFALGAICEELLFRGLLLHSLAGLTRDPWIAILGSSLLFALSHWGLGDQNVFVALWLGLVLGTAYVRSGSLLTVVAAHFLFNASGHVVFVATG